MVEPPLALVFIKIFFYFVYVHVCLHVYVYTMFVSGASGSQKRLLGFLELELTDCNELPRGY